MRKQLTEAEERKRSKGKCIEVRCAKITDNGNLRCAKHAKRHWRKNNPIAAAYARLKASAVKRCLEFSIDFNWFSKYCLAKDYPRVGVHVDRKDATKGYTQKNIRLLSARDNIVKGNKERLSEEYKKSAVARKIAKAIRNTQTSSVKQVDSSIEYTVDEPF